VTRGSSIKVRKEHKASNSLIGRWVTVRIQECHLEVCHQSRLMDTLPRLVGDKQDRVSHRYVIDSLLRKPAGSSDQCFRDDVFPSLAHRQG
jgi:hypothetical protein